MGTMRELLERLTGRYRFTFKPARPVGAGSQGPDTLLVAQPTKLVRVELEYYAQPDRWHATIFDEDAPEDNPHGIVGGQAFAKGLTQDEAEEAAIEVTLKYLGDKGRRPKCEAIDTDFSDPAAKLDGIERRMLKAMVGTWLDVGQIARAVKVDPARVRVRLDNLMELERVERKVAGDRLLYTALQ
jgi:hypothetical protein